MDSVTEIHGEAVRLAKLFSQTNVALIEILQKVIQKNVFVELGYSSLFNYCTDALKLSHDTAYSLWKIAAKGLEVPELKERIARGTISISNARKIVPHITRENSEVWLEKAQTLSQRELEKEIVKENPAAKVRETIKPVAEGLSSIQILLNEKAEKLWRHAKELQMQEAQSAVSNLELQIALLENFIESKDPVRKAQRAAARAQKRQRKSPDVLGVRPKGASLAGRQLREPIPAAVRHAVNLRDQRQCAALLPNVQRCTNRSFLEVHHCEPVSRGGTNTADNLQTLCSVHHKQQHLKVGVRPNLV